MTSTAISKSEWVNLIQSKTGCSLETAHALACEYVERPIDQLQLFTAISKFTKENAVQYFKDDCLDWGIEYIVSNTTKAGSSC
jgi:hypothetical protein